MFASAKSLLLKIPVAIVTALIAVYFLFAWFGFEPLVKWAAPKFIADKSGHRLEIAAARFDPLALAVSIQGLKLTEPDSKPLLAFAELSVDFDAGSLFKRAYALDEIRLTTPVAHLELRADGRLNWAALVAAFQSEAIKDEKTDGTKKEEEPPPRILLRRLVLERGRVNLSDRKAGLETAIDPLDLTLLNLSTFGQDKASYELAAAIPEGLRLRGKGDVTMKPIQAAGELAIEQISLAQLWPYVKDKMSLAAPTGTAAIAFNYQAAYTDNNLSLVLDKLGLSLDKLALKGRIAKEPGVKLDKLRLSGGRFDLEKRELTIGEIGIKDGIVALNRDKAGRLDILDWFVPAEAAAKKREDESAKAVSPPAKTKPAPEAPWKIDLNRFSLDNLGVQLKDATFAAPLTAKIGKVQIGFAAKAEVGGEKTQALVEGLGIDISDIRLQSGNDPAPLFLLGGVILNDGRIDLAQRQVRVGKISLRNGRFDVLRNAQGRIAFTEAFQPVADKSAPAKPVKPVVAKPAPPEDAWRYQINRCELAGFQIGLRDESVQPSAALTLEQFAAAATGISENMQKPLPVSLSFKVREGGSFQAEGKVIPATPAADVKLKLTDLSLTPAQPYLAQAANLILASGRLSAQGRVNFEGQKETKTGALPKVGFQGGFGVADLLVNESEGGARFLAWKRLASDTVRASESAVDIGELRLDNLYAKLVIYKDKTVNLKRILKPGPEKAPSTAGIAPPAKEKTAAEGQAFRIAIERIRIEQGEMDFADYSLAFPFGTRIHNLKGAFNSISSRPGTAAELEIAGQVDEFGMARAVGQIDLFNPTRFTDIKVVFRNVEMTNLTPYSATFAGRKISSGKLSLNLDYKIKDRRLLGENQVIMDKLILGERVESPSARNLPLDLAIAILKDKDGKIDLGLPVSGNLDDPKFSYGQLIWKAITNVLTKIATAPFRALGALFGGGGEKLGQVAFEAGEATLTPPEKEKVKEISQILAKRSGLALSIRGVFAAAVDRPVLKESQLRRALAEKMGLKLAPGEDPGPLSTANPKTREALETLYGQRFGETEWVELRSKWRQANPDKKPDDTPGKMLSRLDILLRTGQPIPSADAAQLKDVDLHVLLYQRLLDKEAISDKALEQLARSRGEALAKELTAAGTPSDRISQGEVTASEAAGKEIPMKLELGVAKN